MGRTVLYKEHTKIEQDFLDIHYTKHTTSYLYFDIFEHCRQSDLGPSVEHVQLDSEQLVIRDY